MGRGATWVVLATFEDEQQEYDFIQRALCCTAVYQTRSNAACKVCYGDAHGESERRTMCVSQCCKDKGKCPVKWKLQTCNVSRRSRIVYQPDCEHARGAEVDCLPNTRTKHSQSIKEYIKKQDESFVRPQRIWLNIVKDSGIPEPPNGYPEQKQVHALLKTIRRKEGSKNSLAAVRSFVVKHAYDPEKHVNTTDASATGGFVFDVTSDDEGLPYIGEGEDDDHFAVGLTSKAMLAACFAICEAGPAILHADATFKLSGLGYPVITCGVTDKGRSYQIAALFIVSHRTTDDYANCMRSLNRLTRRLYNKKLSVHAVMGDAEDAQYNAFKEVQEFAHKPVLMCYFHVLYNVRRHTRSLHSAFANILMASIADMHYARDEADLFQIQARAR